MKSILEELFYGNVCPGTDFRSKDAKARKLMEHLANHQKHSMTRSLRNSKNCLKSLMIAMVN